MSEGEFSVCQFFRDDSYEYVCRFVDAASAAEKFKHYTTSVGAQIGTTVRVIITDGGDCTNAEWQFGKGHTYPPRRLEHEWHSYRDQVVPKGADAVQVEECRRAFYAGAASIHNVIMKMLDPTADATDADVQKMQDLVEELDAFALSVRPTNPKDAA
jgi:hypothetical protein